MQDNTHTAVYDNQKIKGVESGLDSAVVHRYRWQNQHNIVLLNPRLFPAHPEACDKPLGCLYVPLYI